MTDYQGATNTYGEVAEKIARLHLLFEACGLQKGDKVGMVGRNQAHWGISFLATLSYGAVAVPILHEFKDESVRHIVNHSEARILFAGDVAREYLLDDPSITDLGTVILLSNFSVSRAKDASEEETNQRIDTIFQQRYPRGFSKEHIVYHEDQLEELAVINYTSGTTGFSKGVMLPYRSVVSNINFAKMALKDLLRGDSIVSMLPMAHMYGLMFEFLYEIFNGCHIYFLSRMPTPKIIMDAFAEIRPRLIIAVPLIIEKIYKKKLQPVLDKPIMKLLLHLPFVKQVIHQRINAQLSEAFGNNFLVIVVGGAAFNPEVEAFMKTINFRFTVGYGMTECGPLITYGDWKDNRLYACGRVVPQMEVKIDSPDPANVVGEILTRGENLMLGYYKNQETTDSVLIDGWLHTGDLGVMDKDGYLFIKGRSKNMILGPSGQNIYPEEIENHLNNMPYVVESLVVDREGKLTALVFPDYEAAKLHKLSNEAIEKMMEENRLLINKALPQYSQVAKLEVFAEEFEKTPKRSIKRFMYQ